MFLNPLMLAGLGGALLPLVLHLLSRSRFRTVDWAAMMFLQGTSPSQRQSTRLKQLLLLLLRMLLVALLAIALARPLVSDSFAAVASGGHLSAVIVIDGSLSTSVTEKGKPRADLIRQAAIQVLSSLQKGDEAAVIVAGSPGHVPQMSTDLSRLADEIAVIKPAGRANLAECLARASDLLNTPESTNRRLFVICDRQAISWSEVDAAFRAAWVARAARDKIATPLMIVPIGSATADNLAMQGLAVLNPPIVHDQPTEFEAKIRNYGAVRRPAVPVVLTAGGRDVGHATIDCPPDSTVPVRITARLVDAGPQVVTATIQPTAEPSSGLTADDSFDLALDVNDPTRVLILSGDERSPKSAAESYFAAIALQPFAAAGRQGADPCKVTVQPIQAATPADLQAAQVVVLANVSALSPVMASAVEQFIYDGGGMLVAPGALTRAADFNERFYRAGGGWLPAQISPPPSQLDASTIATLDATHPVLQFLHGRPEVPSATFGRWFKLGPLRSDARKIASLANGDAFAAECAVGRGRVMLLATPIDADWSTLPITSFYLPFLQSSVRWLAGGGADRNLAVGSPINYAWTANDVRTPTMILPDGRTAALDPQRQGDRSEIRFAGTDSPGVYKLKFPSRGAGSVVPFVVTGPTDESDLTPMRASDWKSLTKDLNATLIDANGRSMTEVLAANRAGREIWGLLLLSVIACALAETWLAGRWSRED